MFDNHMHSEYSCDIPKGTGSTIRELCLSAIEKGVEGIAVTDHFDIDAIYDGFFAPLDHEAIYKEITELQEEFKGNLKILHGIELGQATHMPVEAHEQLNSYPYDIVLGSVHAVRGIVDFSETDIKSLTKNEYVALWEQYIKEMLDTISWGNFDVLTHITYPKRYYLSNGITDFPDIKNNKYVGLINGEIDYHSIFNYLKFNNYNGFVSAEFHFPLNNDAANNEKKFIDSIMELINILKEREL